MGNCLKCVHITSDYDEGYGASDYCEKMPKLSNLKSFPFKKDMECFEMNFWHSEFADEVEIDDEESFNIAFNKFKEKEEGK